MEKNHKNEKLPEKPELDEISEFTLSRLNRADALITECEKRSEAPRNLTSLERA